MEALVWTLMSLVKDVLQIARQYGRSAGWDFLRRALAKDGLQIRDSDLVLRETSRPWFVGGAEKSGLVHKLSQDTLGIAATILWESGRLDYDHFPRWFIDETEKSGKSNLGELLKNLLDGEFVYTPKSRAIYRRNCEVRRL